MNTIYKLIRLLPYIIVSTVALVIFCISKRVNDLTYQTVMLNIFSNALFLLIAYFFYDLIKIIIFKREKRYLDEYIKNQISNDVFVVLYYLKKVIHGYNLETNTLGTILGLVNYSTKEIKNSVTNQNYIGFQILKQTDEIRNLFKDVLNDNLILQYTTHLDVINLLKINSILSRIEYLLKNEDNFRKCAENGVEFEVVNGKRINPENDEKFLLLKKTKIPQRFVVYDSGFFNTVDQSKLLYRYVLKKDSAKLLTENIFELFSLLKYWIPSMMNLSRQENRFRIIKNYFSPVTKTKTIKSDVFVADIIDIK